MGGTRMKQSFKAKILEFGFGISRQYPLIGRGSIHQSCYVDFIKVIFDVVKTDLILRIKEYFSRKYFMEKHQI